MTPAAGTVEMPAKSNAKKKVGPEPKPSAPGLIIHRLELTPESKAQVVAVSDRLGMTQIAALSRLVEWFAGQSPDVQRLVHDGGNAARPILERMAAAGRK